MKRLSLTLLVLASWTLASGQNSMMDNFVGGRDIVDVFEKEKYEVVRVDFNVLTTNDPREETIRNLSKGYKYSIIAYADGTRITKLAINLQENRDGKWVIVAEGKPLDAKGSAMTALVYDAKQDAQALIQVEAVSFADGATTGRSVFVVGHKEGAVELVTTSIQDVRFKNEKFTTGDNKTFNSTFTFTDTNITHTFGDKAITYTIKETKKIEGGVIYTVEDPVYKQHVIMVLASLIDVYSTFDKKVYDGVRYTLQK